MKFYQEPGNDFVGVVFHTKTVGVIKIYWKKNVQQMLNPQNKCWKK